MGDIYDYIEDQEALVEEAERKKKQQQARKEREAFKKDCQQRLQEADAVKLNSAIEALLTTLYKQQLTQNTFELMEDLKKVWYGKK